jgi:hypothetical protein
VTAVGHAAIIVAERKGLLARTESLIREFHPTLPAGTVIHAVTRCRAELLRAGVRRGLASSTEALVRVQLRRITETRSSGCTAIVADDRQERPASGGRRHA